MTPARFIRATWVAAALLALSCAGRQQPTAAPAPVATARLAPPAAPAPAAAAMLAAPPLPAAPPPFRLAFGSCNDVDRPQTMWPKISAFAPAVWLWLGDNIYADTQDMTVMRGMYDALRADTGYAALRAQARVIGTWDDHDYGENNAGREYPKRAEAQQLLLDFLDEPKDSPRRRQAGVYTTHDFGAPPYQVRVILLDTRYHRDPPNTDGDVLGPQQWSWLETQLRGSPAAVTLIGSSIQVLADEHPFEKWGNFPTARARLLHLIAQSGARNVIVLSGDRHFAELTRVTLPQGGHELYDMTSSSLNRAWHGANDVNRNRVGALYPGPNFGSVDVDWQAQPPSVLLRVHDEHGQTQIEARVPLLP